MPDPLQTSAPSRQAKLAARIAEVIGAENVSTEGSRLDFMARDVFRLGGLPALVIRPRSVLNLQSAVALCTEAGVAIVPRGGGTSYTDGYVYAAGGHAIFDLGALDSIEIDEANAVVSVGAGVTWAALKARLAERGLRTPFWGPFSGLVATVCGSVSQNSISHGSGAHGVSAQSVLSMDIVLASGELLSTGISSATRFFGPDLTGLFTGDCGALGIKAVIRLPLIAARNHFEALSFAFDDFETFCSSLQMAAREGLDDEHFGLDIALSQGQIGKQEGLGSRLKIAAEVFRSAPNALAGVTQLLRMLAAGDKVLGSGAYMCHFIVEGASAEEASAKAKRLRALMQGRGHTIPNSVPAFVRALPFAPLTNMLGPKGERWVPLHGILPHGRVQAFHNALQQFYAKRQTEMGRLGVSTGAMFCSVGSTGLLYELAIYWRDAPTAFHQQMIDGEYLNALPKYPSNTEAFEFVDTMKMELMALYADCGAAHFQIGRAYSYAARLDPQAMALLKSLKATLDPKNLMNPGALGLGLGAAADRKLQSTVETEGSK